MKFYCLKKWFFCLLFFFFNFSVVLTRVFTGWLRRGQQVVLRARSGRMWCPLDGVLVDPLEPPSSPRGSWEPPWRLVSSSGEAQCLVTFSETCFCGPSWTGPFGKHYLFFPEYLILSHLQIWSPPGLYLWGRPLHLSESVTSEKLPGPGRLGCSFQLPAACGKENARSQVTHSVWGIWLCQSDHCIVSK